MTISHSTISSNSAAGYGGGIYNCYGTVIGNLPQSTNSGNSANDGWSGIYNDSGKVTISHSTISGNGSPAAMAALPMAAVSTTMAW